MPSETIAAVATPIGKGGIGIIRLSGKQSLTAIAAIFKPSSPKLRLGNAGCLADSHKFDSHRLYHGNIINPETGHVIDEVLVSLMRAPHSYTREDVIEIQSHSGLVVLNEILKLVLKQDDIRVAEPGEFTKRAFLNGRIDLTQAEAIIDVVNAKSDKALEVASAQISGQLKNALDEIRKELLNIQTILAAYIDFPDDIDEDFDTQATVDSLQRKIIEPLQQILQEYDNKHVIREGLRISIIGRPNVGKSSLMNALIKKDRSIVTSLPGTTRDIIEENINVRGLPLIFTDTAGLHNSQDPIEVLGMERTRYDIEKCDLILFMVDASQPLLPDDLRIYTEISGKPYILVRNKIDLARPAVEFGDSFDGQNCLAKVDTAAILHRGVSELEARIVDGILGREHLDSFNPLIPNLRQKEAIERSLMACKEAKIGIQCGRFGELLAIDIQAGIDALDETIGIKIKIDILDEIFNRFCIGK